MPTIAQKVPRAAWAFAARRLKDAVSIPVIASNRINTPEVAEAILARGDADLVSMARPMLADPEFANKAREGRADEINVCIACNQACLDLIFSKRVATCLVNPEGRPRDRVRRAAAGARQAHRGGRRRAGGPRLRRDGGRARACRDALRGGGPDRRPAQPRPQRAGQGGVRRDACATIGAASSGSASTLQLGAAPGRGRAGGARLRRDRRCDRRHAAHARHSRHRARQLRELRRHPRRRVARPGGASPSSARAASASTSRSS